MFANAHLNSELYPKRVVLAHPTGRPDNMFNSLLPVNSLKDTIGTNTTHTHEIFKPHLNNSTQVLLNQDLFVAKTLVSEVHGSTRNLMQKTEQS
jgi:hypothetical protein